MFLKLTAHKINLKSWARFIFNEQRYQSPFYDINCMQHYSFIKHLFHACQFRCNRYMHIYVYVLCHFSCVQLFGTPWTVAHQAPVSMGFSRQDTGVGCLFLPQCVCVCVYRYICVCVCVYIYIYIYEYVNAYIY